MEKLSIDAGTLASRASVSNMLASKPKRKAMTEHSGLPVKGYGPQSEMKVQAVNHNKELEEVILRVCDSLSKTANIDQRWLAIGRTHIEQGFMAINRSVFKPGRVTLASDGPGPELDMRKPSDPGDASQDMIERKFREPDRQGASGGTETPATATEVPGTRVPPAKRDDIVA